GQFWAGKRWGAFFWPRIGQEVIVDYLEGDPDQPIIVGSVYNADQMPPYLGQGPDSKHPNDNKVSGVKSNSTKGGVGYNEWRFDDTKGKEQIFIHGERNIDTRIKNNCMENIGNNRNLTIGGVDQYGKKYGDHRERSFRDKHLTVERHHLELIKGNMELCVGGGDEGAGSQDILIKGKKTETIGDEYHLHVKKHLMEKVEEDFELTVKNRFVMTGESDQLHVKGQRATKVDASDSLTVGTDKQEKIGQKYAAEAGQEIHLKAGMKVIIEAGVQLTLKGPGGFVDIGPTGVTIQGTMVLINSGGAAGSGSGSSPTAPNDPDPPDDAKEANPTKPDQADDSKTGYKSCPG
ncbi:MAG: phage baseplate assembly protein V, partial [Pyrinomonadaceae bacterium]